MVGRYFGTNSVNSDMLRVVVTNSKDKRKLRVLSLCTRYLMFCESWIMMKSRFYVLLAVKDVLVFVLGKYVVNCRKRRSSSLLKAKLLPELTRFVFALQQSSRLGHFQSTFAWDLAN